MKNKNIVLIIAVVIALIAAFIAGVVLEVPKEVRATYVYGTVVAKSEDSIVIECDNDFRELTGQSYCVFRVDKNSLIYGMNGMTPVSLNEIDTGYYVEIIYDRSEKEVERTDILLDQIKVKIKDFVGESN